MLRITFKRIVKAIIQIINRKAGLDTPRRGFQAVFFAIGITSALQAISIQPSAIRKQF